MLATAYAFNPEYEKLLCDQNWEELHSALANDTTWSEDLVSKFVYNQTCIASNHIEKIFDHTPEDIIIWAQWTANLKKKYPENCAAYYLHGDAILLLKLYDEALLECDKTVELNENFALAYCLRGRILAAKNNSIEAIKEYSRALNKNPELCEFLFLRGVEYHKQGRYNNSISDFSKAIQIIPDNAKVFNKRGLSFFKREKYEQAIFDYNDALQLNPDLVPAYLNRANAYFENRQMLECITDYQIFLKYHPENLEANIKIAQAYQQFGEFVKALRHLNQALVLDRGNFELYLLKSQICEDAELFLEAIEACRLYIKYAPSDEQKQIDNTFDKIEQLKKKLAESQL